VSVVQAERGAQLLPRELMSRLLEAQHCRHRQLHPGCHLHAALGDDRLRRRSERRADAGVAIPVGEPVDVDFLHRRQRHDSPVVPFEPRRLDRHIEAPKGELVAATLEIYGGAVCRGEPMGDAEAVKVGGEAQARVVRAWRRPPLFGKEEGKAVDRSGEGIRPPLALFSVEIGHLGQGDHLVLAAAAFGRDCVHRGDCPLRIAVVALGEDPAAQDIACRRAEVVRREDVCGKLAAGRAGFEALYADRRLAPGSKE
jgi:hypothetical protein